MSSSPITLCDTDANFPHVLTSFLAFWHHPSYPPPPLPPRLLTYLLGQVAGELIVLTGSTGLPARKPAFPLVSLAVCRQSTFYHFCLLLYDNAVTMTGADRIKPCVQILKL